MTYHRFEGIVAFLSRTSGSCTKLFLQKNQDISGCRHEEVVKLIQPCTKVSGILEKASSSYKVPFSRVSCFLLLQHC